MSKGRRAKRSGWVHPKNLNRDRRRSRLRQRSHPLAVARRRRAEELQLRELDEGT